MSKTNYFEYSLLQHIFNGVALTPNLGATGGTTQLWLGLHTADPGEAGSTANEGGYTAYARVAVERSTSGWVASSNATTAPASVSPVANVDFPQVATTSTGTYTHGSVFPASNTTGPQALYTGAITPNINFSQNVTPRITTASAITEQ
jgi:hypothetical protein